MRPIVKACFLVLLLGINSCRATGGVETANLKPAEKSTDKVNLILKDLNRAISKLQTYSCRIEYLFSQPLFESETLRCGMLYYQRGKEPENSKLRINFQTLKQDDSPEEHYRDEYIFDGLRLTHIDYRIKEVRIHRLAEVNEPNTTPDVFKQLGNNFPIIGFSKPEELKKEFEITLIEQKETEADDFVKLHLKPKPDSAYKDKYTAIDFRVDKKTYLPAKIIAVSTEDDIYQISFLDAKVNTKLKKKIFRIEVPEGFTRPEIVPLKQIKNKK